MSGKIVYSTVMPQEVIFYFERWQKAFREHKPGDNKKTIYFLEFCDVCEKHKILPAYAAKRLQTEK